MMLTLKGKGGKSSAYTVAGGDPTGPRLTLALKSHAAKPKINSTGPST